MAPTRYPPGIWRNICGSVIKASSGPAFGSTPKENTAGKISIPAIIAKRESPNAVIAADEYREKLAGI